MSACDVPPQMKALALSILLATTALAAEPAVQSNVVYGMYSGAALLMDVHRPERPNGYGIILVSGSGWSALMAYSVVPLKSNSQSLQYARPLVAAGYTVFTLNHRALPRFHYPAAVEDVQRAVRFVRGNAAGFGIRPDRIGAVGGSSGGHLVSMLGTLDGKGNPDDPDPVERESKVQCVVARAAPCQLLQDEDCRNRLSRDGYPIWRQPGRGEIAGVPHLLRSIANLSRLTRRPAVPADARRQG